MKIYKLYGYIICVLYYFWCVTNGEYDKRKKITNEFTEPTSLHEYFYKDVPNLLCVKDIYMRTFSVTRHKEIHDGGFCSYENQSKSASL